MSAMMSLEVAGTPAQTLLVTGGAGFIGSNFVLRVLSRGASRVVNLDALTYAGNLESLADVADHPGHVFVRGDIGDRRLVDALLAEYRPSAIVNFAAETHVDRSIEGPERFVEANVLSTLRLLEAVRMWLRSAAMPAFRFLHVSTDEVYGSLAPEDLPFSEASRYEPNSPYAASKAAGDHLVRAYGHTYGLPTIITNCSNNYGPRQFPEKLIPLMILRAISGQDLPVYGDGLNVRDWLYVEDHCDALLRALANGNPGATYNIGGNAELTNIDVVRRLCAALDERAPRPDGRPHATAIRFVSDRPGHDRRYAIDAGKARAELGWEPAETFRSGLTRTIDWYLGNRAWLDRVTSGAYRDWVDRNYGSRGAS